MYPQETISQRNANIEANAKGNLRRGLWDLLLLPSKKQKVLVSWRQPKVPLLQAEYQFTDMIMNHDQNNAPSRSGGYG